MKIMKHNFTVFASVSMATAIDIILIDPGSSCEMITSLLQNR